MTVTKSEADVYRVRMAHEWATIVVQEWRRGDLQQGEPLVHSSFGSWAHQWSNVGIPLRQHLLKASFDSVRGKMLGRRVQAFDSEASPEHWKRPIVTVPRAREFAREECEGVDLMSAAE